ncbi:MULTISPECIES: MoaD/ThiS family protein [Chryseobacterium]|jgi:molybdopterin synthase sulfur carrier subunit|uniref:Molybdopterin synthase sulfur carrier subunit n=1 Tax=Chryseobacterium rhizosphaerae TaxID=395937 RepID=A0ABX9INH7_9FLAO|nr:MULTISPECIES: MoaD/ThiS family protein [Chryseobacterium]MBL3547123.1 MoaD/ThiS family protein [Chryseobacterium sp. KMC2]REC76954.1 MoaD/ThiS family protein [Chryseobacterium rhizosphaerae]GEN66453.1 molybdopterin synthase sulfur carrier subunit [Chryseobacterium rhizosphaerae]SMC96636.1 molybdopterin synthase sulfur carrier subunit [Chryseobacterium sp. YR221]
MKLNILAFGIAKDIFGTPDMEIETTEDLNVGQLKDILEDRFPQLRKLKSYFIAVDEEYADDDRIITGTNEIAVIPPVSGG